MYLVFELLMRYVDYKTFRICSLLNKECNRICRKMVPELKRTFNNINSYDLVEKYETFWNKKREGLCYYINDTNLTVIDYENGIKMASFKYSIVREYLEVNGKKYYAKLDIENKKIILKKLGYRTEFSLKPILHSPFFL